MSRIKVATGNNLYKMSVWTVFLILGAALGHTPVFAESTLPPPEPARRAAVVHLVRQDCGSCHGLTLKGGLGPALTREALAGKPPEGLRATILHGRPGTPMPPWRDFLTENEVNWLVEVLMQGRLDAEK